MSQHFRLCFVNIFLIQQLTVQHLFILKHAEEEPVRT